MGATPYILYLSIIGFAAFSYVLYAYRGRLGTMVQSALIWVLIFLAAITLYDFKNNFTGRISGIVQSDADTILLPRATDGHYYARVKVNGVSVNFMVDTGASDIVLSTRDAERIGVDFERLIFLGEAETANGIVRTARVNLETVELGEIVDYNLSASITDGETDSSLLGMAYLSRFSRIEIQDGALFLHR